MNCWENSVRVRCLCQSPEQDSACRFLAWRGILPPTEQRRLQSGPPWCSPCRKRPHPRVHPIHRKCQQWSCARSNLRKDDSTIVTLYLSLAGNAECYILYLEMRHLFLVVPRSLFLPIEQHLLLYSVPASPMGPPMMKFPHGLMWYFVSLSKYLSGMTSLTTFAMISSLSTGRVTCSECWTETTTVWTLMGTHAPLSNL